MKVHIMPLQKGLASTLSSHQDQSAPQIPFHRLSLGDVPLDADGVSHRRFADTMAHLASTVSVVTSGVAGQWEGRTVTAMASLSATPPSLMVSITKGSALAAEISRTSGFSVAMLAADQSEISDIFAGKPNPGSRFDTGEWQVWASGRPKLSGAVAVIDCQLAGMIELDTHCLFAGVLIASEYAERKPLLWHNRGYAHLAD